MVEPCSKCFAFKGGTHIFVLPHQPPLQRLHSALDKVSAGRGRLWIRRACLAL